MIKKKLYIFYLIGLGLTISSMSFSMQPIIASTCTLASTNPVQQFTIAKHLVLHSAAIESYLNNPAFKKESCFHVENTTPQDVLHLIACLKKIDSITKNNAATSASSNKRTLAQQMLMQYTSCLAIDELITLAQNSDYLLINQKHLTKSIAQSLGKKIITTPSDAQSIFQAIPNSLHKKVMQALNKQASIDGKLMQSYSELLEPTCSIPLLHPQYLQRLFIQIGNAIKTDTKYKLQTTLL